MRIQLKKGKKYYFLLLIIYMFLLANPIETILPFFSFFDELLAIFGILIILIKVCGEKKLDRKELFRMIPVAVFLLSGIVGNAKFHFQPLSVALYDVFLNIKYWFVLFLGAYIGHKIDFKNFAQKIGKHVEWITYVFLLLFIADNTIGIFTPIYRYGIRSAHLIYYHPTYFSAACVFLIIILTSCNMHKEKKITTFLLLILLCLTLRSKSIAMAFAILAVYYWAYKRKGKIKLKHFFIFIPVVIAIGWNQIQYYFFSSIKDDSARNVLLLKSIEIAKDLFPLGAGFGTYASYLSGVHYSPLYDIYHLSNIHGLTRIDHSYMSDSFWPMIIGQNGFIGLFAFCTILLILIKKIVKERTRNTTYYIASIIGIIYMFVSSTAESSFVHPMTVPIAFWIGIMLGNKRLDIRNLNFLKVY